MTAGGGAPTLSIITIVFNDEARLERAVRSVLTADLLDAEVIVVDDGSSDRSADVADSLAAEDPRVRVVRRASNSGGCGAPRNDGMRAARGRWVAFLDSDDQYLPGGLRRLLDIAEHGDVDVVSGPAARFSERLGRATTVFNEGYHRSGGSSVALDGRDDVFWDTIAPAKVFRREFLERHDLQFPEDIRYEDLLLTALVWLARPRLHVVTEPVYLWHIAHDPESPSITSSRHEISNWQDRLESHRRIDAAIDADPDAARLRALKLEKFARHDLKLYARDLPLRDSEYVTAFVRSAQDYLGSLSGASMAQLRQPHRLMLRTLLDGDARSVVAAASFVHRKGQLSDPLLVEGDHLVWPWTHGLANPKDYRMTAYVATLARRGRLVSPFTRVTSIDPGHDGLVVTGEASTVLPGSPMAFDVELRERGGAPLLTVSVSPRPALLRRRGLRRWKVIVPWGAMPAGEAVCDLVVSHEGLTGTPVVSTATVEALKEPLAVHGVTAVLGRDGGLVLRRS